MKKVAIYIRVSTQEQEKEGYSIPAQKEKLLLYSKAKDWLVHDIYIDGGYSGSNIDRPALNRLLNTLQDIDIVLVYKLDRLSRSQKDTLYLIEDKFLENNVGFVSMTENFDTTTPFGRAQIGILSVFAQLERENIKERSMLGRLERAKRGLWTGTPNPPLGYDLIDSNLIVNEYEKIQVLEVIELYKKGWGKERIQNYMIKKGYTNKYGTWKNVSTHIISRIIKNRHYVGEVSFAGKWYKGIHEPIIDIDTFDKLNKMKESRIRNDTKLKYFLSTMLYCEKCNAKYITDSKDRKRYYVCKNRKHGYKQDFKCTNTIFRVEELEEQAIKKIKDIIKNKDKLIKEKYKNIDKSADKINIDTLQSRIGDIEKQINKLMDLYQIDNISLDVISERIAKLDKEKKIILKEIEKNKVKNNDTIIDVEEIIEILKNFDEVWDRLEVIEKRDVAMALLGKKIYVNEKGV